MKVCKVLASNLEDSLEDCELGKAIELLEGLKKEHTGYNKLYLEVDYEEDYYGDTRYTRISLMGEREETSIERFKRKNEVVELKKAQEAQEKKTLERLKKKYE